MESSVVGENYKLAMRIDPQKKGKRVKGKKKAQEGEGGMMGRWEYESTTLAEDGKLTLHNAIRIPRKDGIIENEFLIDGQNKPRDIVLQTRGLNNDEKKKIAGKPKKMGMKEEVRVIIRDNVAIHNRIYGIGVEGIAFIREDIISEGNRNQIKEAIDHERRELTTPGHDDIRAGQFKGNLRSLITQLSDKDKAIILHHLSDDELILLNLKEDPESKHARDDTKIRVQIIQIELALGRDEKKSRGKADQVIADLDSKKTKFKGEEVHILNGVGRDAMVIGRVDRKIAETYGYIHETANVVLIIPEGKVLLQLRNKDNFDDHLAMYGGHLSVGESHASAVMEETLQETGLDKLDSNPIFIGYEGYNVDGDSNKERRSWFVKVLTEREYAKIKNKIDKLRDLKKTLARPAVKAALFEEQKEKKDGSGEVIGIYPISLEEISEAKTKPYEKKSNDPITPFEGKPVRFLIVHDEFQGKDKPVKAYFAPDSLDHLLSSGDLWSQIKLLADQAMSAEKNEGKVSQRISGDGAVQINLNQDGSWSVTNIVIPKNIDLNGSLYRARKSEILDIKGTDYVIKFISDPEYALAVKRGYTLAKQRLGDLIAPYVLTTKIFSSSNPLPSSFSIVQKRVQPARKIFAEYRKHDHAKAEAMIKAMIEIDREIIRRGLFLVDWKIENFGVMEDGKVVLIDPTDVVESPTEKDFFNRAGAYYRFNENFRFRGLEEWGVLRYFHDGMPGSRDSYSGLVESALKGDISARQQLIIIGKKIYDAPKKEGSLAIVDESKEEEVLDSIKSILGNKDVLHLNLVVSSLDSILYPGRHELKEDRVFRYLRDEDRFVLQSVQKIDSELLWSFDTNSTVIFSVQDGNYVLKPVSPGNDLSSMLNNGLGILLPIIRKNKDLQNYWSSVLDKSENTNIHIVVAPKGAMSPSLTSLRIRRPSDGQVFIFFQHEFFTQLLTAYPTDYNDEDKGIYFAERLFKELGMPDIGHYSDEDINSIIRVMQNDALLQKFLGATEITRGIGDGDTYEEQTISYRKIVEDFYDSGIEYTGPNMGGQTRGLQDRGHWFRSGFYYRDLLKQQVAGVDNPEILKLRMGQYFGSFVQEHDKAMLSSSSINEDKQDVGGIDLNDIEVERQGAGVNIQFAPDIIQPILDSGVDGFAPVIINLTPINNIMPFLGLEPQNQEKHEMSKRNK